MSCTSATPSTSDDTAGEPPGEFPRFVRSANNALTLARNRTEPVLVQVANVVPGRTLVQTLQSFNSDPAEVELTERTLTLQLHGLLARGERSLALVNPSNTSENEENKASTITLNVVDSDEQRWQLETNETPVPLFGSWTLAHPSGVVALLVHNESPARVRGFVPQAHGAGLRPSFNLALPRWPGEPSRLTFVEPDMLAWSNAAEVWACQTPACTPERIFTLNGLARPTDEAISFAELGAAGTWLCANVEHRSDSETNDATYAVHCTDFSVTSTWSTSFGGRMQTRGWDHVHNGPLIVTNQGGVETVRFLGQRMPAVPLTRDAQDELAGPVFASSLGSFTTIVRRANNLALVDWSTQMRERAAASTIVTFAGEPMAASAVAGTWIVMVSQAQTTSFYALERDMPRAFATLHHPCEAVFLATTTWGCIHDSTLIHGRIALDVRGGS